MEKPIRLVMLLFAAAVLLSGHAIAEEKKGQEGQGNLQKQTQTQSPQTQSLRAVDALTGLTVQNPQGEKLGEISEVLVDVQDGQLGYAIVSSGGVLGMGEQKYIVPFRALQLGEGDTLLLDIPADRFKQAPQGQVEQAFSQDKGRQIHQFYGVSPYWEESGAQQQPTQPNNLGGQTQ